MSNYLTGLRLQNFLCYRGEQEITLGPGVFGVVAKRDGDDRRSNYQGKTSFLRSIRFLLTGDHAEPTEDEWITDDEPDGGVDGEFANGVFASRTRKRGGPTKLRVIVPEEDGTERELLENEAQDFLDTMVGGNKDEQAATWWTAQKAADSYVSADPAELSRTVGAWLGLEPVRRSCKRIGEQLRELLKHHDQHAASAQQANATIERLLEGFESKRLNLWMAAQAAELVVADVKLKMETDAGARAAHAAQEALARDYESYQQLIKQIADVDVELTAIGILLPETKRALQESFAKANTAHIAQIGITRDRRVLARGQFDGKCPVGGIACPVKDTMNNDAAVNTERLKIAMDAEHETAVKSMNARSALESHEKTERRHGDLTQRRAVLDQQAVRLQRQAERYTSRNDEPAPTESTQLANELRMAQETSTRLVRDLARVDEEKKNVELYTARAAALLPEITAHREALAILGPAGVQRRLSEALVEEVEGDANALLSEGGVDVVLRFQWSKEGKQLADACVQCGSPFPSSRKVKACETCGAERGNKLEQKWRVVVEPRSGGFEDLGGVAFRLAAAAWLKVKRGSAWSVACLDEPLAHCDAFNRHVVARHLMNILSTKYAVDQAFITAHDVAVLDALPRRILITGTPSGSKIEVVS